MKKLFSLFLLAGILTTAVSFGQVAGDSTPYATTAKEFVFGSSDNGTYKPVVHIVLPPDNANSEYTITAPSLSATVGDAIMLNTDFAYCSVNPADALYIDFAHSSPTCNAAQQFSPDVRASSSNLALKELATDWSDIDTSILSPWGGTQPGFPMTAKNVGTVNLQASGKIVLKGHYYKYSNSYNSSTWVPETTITVSVTLPVIVSDSSVAPTAPQAVRAH